MSSNKETLRSVRPHPDVLALQLAHADLPSGLWLDRWLQVEPDIESTMNDGISTLPDLRSSRQ